MNGIGQEPEKLPREAVRRRLGRNLAALRVRRKWSQEKLARKLGVTRSRLGKWETGEHAPPVELLTALATALGVELAEIVAGMAPSPQLREDKK
jgi:transcriptional regulator with XRE-family HTH domain